MDHDLIDEAPTADRESWNAKIRNGEPPSIEDVVLRYAAHADSFDMTDEQKAETIIALWGMMQSYMSVLFGTDPVHLARRERPVNAGEASDSMLEFITSVHDQKEEENPKGGPHET